MGHADERNPLIYWPSAVGLDAGPMQGLNKAADDVYWAGKVKTNFICSIGHSDGNRV